MFAMLLETETNALDSSGLNNDHGQAPGTWSDDQTESRYPDNRIHAIYVHKLDGFVDATFQNPFNLLLATPSVSSHSGDNAGGNSVKSEIWLGREDSNLRMPVPKTGALGHLATPHPKPPET